MRPRPAVSLLAAALLAATACGSTVAPPQAGGTAAASVADGMQGPVDDSVAGSPAQPAPAGSADAAPVGNGSAPGAGPGGSPGGSPGGGERGTGGSAPRDAGTPPASSPHSGPVRLGIPYTANAGEANSSAGSDSQTGDQRAQWRILFDDLNARGGLLGRDVEPEFYAYDAFGNFTAQQQAACTHFTQDRPVNAVLGSGINFVTEAFNACLERAGVAFIDGGVTSWDEALLRRHPHQVLANTFTLDRMAAATVDGVAAHGWLAPDARIGLVTYDDPTYDRVVQESLVPALRAHGAKLAEHARVTKPQSYGDLGSQSAEVSSAVLRFRTNGIDHVLFLEVGGDIAFFFMNAAEGQAYRPRYGLNSQDGGMLLVGQVPPGQLTGAVGIGWLPTSDVRPDDNPMRDTRTRRRCLNVYRRGGVTPTDANAETIALGSCDLLWLYAAAVTRSGDASADGFIAGVERLARHPSATTFATAFGPGRHSGATAYRLVRYASACGCLRYVGGNRTAP